MSRSFGGLGVGAERGLALRAEAHRGEVERGAVPTGARVHFVAVAHGVRVAPNVFADVEQLADGDGLRLFDLAQARDEILVGLLAARDFSDDVPDRGLLAELALQDRRPSLRRFVFDSSGGDLQALARVRVHAREREAGGVGAAVVGRAEVVGHVGREADRREETTVAVEFVDAHRREHFLDADFERARRRCANACDVLRRTFAPRAATSKSV